MRLILLHLSLGVKASGEKDRGQSYEARRLAPTCESSMPLCQPVLLRCQVADQPVALNRMLRHFF